MRIVFPVTLVFQDHVMCQTCLDVCLLLYQESIIKLCVRYLQGILVRVTCGKPGKTLYVIIITICTYCYHAHFSRISFYIIDHQELRGAHVSQIDIGFYVVPSPQGSAKKLNLTLGEIKVLGMFVQSVSLVPLTVFIHFRCWTHVVYHHHLNFPR